MRIRFQDVGNAVVMIAAVVVAATVVHREFGSKNRAPGAGASDAPVFVSDWKSFVPHGIQVGDATAPVTIIEFSDFECPFCRKFQSSLDSVRHDREKLVSFVFVHFPLPMHRFARPAARAAECASTLGKFDDFQRVVFEKQDSLGLKTWGSYAIAAGILDTSAFVRCAAGTELLPRVEDGLAMGNKLGVKGTPTVLVNGWRFTALPTDSLAHMVDRIISGKSPIPGGDTAIRR